MIPIQNIYYMLSYAFQILNEQGYKNVAAEEFDNVAELCAAIIARGMTVQLKRGLVRAYVEQTEEMPQVRGRIMITDTVRARSLDRKKVICSYDEFSTNAYLNRIVKTTMLFLLHQDIKQERKKELRRVLVFLEEVEPLDIHSINWQIPYNQNNQSYRMLIGICYLVIKGLIQTRSDGTLKLMDFMDEQRECDLYERFLREYYKKEYPQIQVSASKIDWNIDEGFSSALLPEMKTDVTLEYKNKVLIIDAKYYGSNLREHYGALRLNSGNFYQIHAYVTNKADEKDYDAVSGMLLYAGTDAEVQPNETVSIHGHRYSARTLDLNRSFSEIRADLNGIVEEYLNVRR